MPFSGEKTTIDRTSRSYRRFVKSVCKKTRIHDELLDRRRFSLEPSLGKLAIHASSEIDHRSLLSGSEQVAAFNEEAEQLQEKHEKSGAYQQINVYSNTNRLALDQDLMDPEVASIIIIGHGCLGDYWLRGGHYTWHDVAKSSNRHLKQGIIEQRMCGTVSPKVLTVPWGVFALADQSKLLAAAGVVVPDKNPDDFLFEPIFDKSVNSAEEILAKVEQYRYVA